MFKIFCYFKLKSFDLTDFKIWYTYIRNLFAKIEEIENLSLWQSSCLPPSEENGTSLIAVPALQFGGALYLVAHIISYIYRGVANVDRIKQDFHLQPGAAIGRSTAPSCEDLTAVENSSQCGFNAYSRTSFFRTSNSWAFNIRTHTKELSLCHKRRFF